LKKVHHSKSLSLPILSPSSFCDHWTYSTTSLLYQHPWFISYISEIGEPFRNENISGRSFVCNDY